MCRQTLKSYLSHQQATEYICPSIVKYNGLLINSLVWNEQLSEWQAIAVPEHSTRLHCNPHNSDVGRFWEGREGLAIMLPRHASCTGLSVYLAAPINTTCDSSMTYHTPGSIVWGKNVILYGYLCLATSPLQPDLIKQQQN